MGKTEKIVVLSILFLVVVLFVWSLGGDGPDAKVKDGEAGQATYTAGAGDSRARVEHRPSAASAAPGGAPGEAMRGAAASEGESRVLQRPKTNPAGPGGPSSGDLASGTSGSGASGSGASGTEEARITLDPAVAEAGSGMLFAGVDKRGPASGPERVPTAVKMRPGWAIVTTSGLETTVDPNMLLYRPAPDDTWESLAADLYGDATKDILLRHNNEGMDAPGEVIFVPARDEGADEVGTRVVEVLQGETLWQVSKRTLGKGSRWQEIFAANRGVISDPDFLAPGTRLTIPAD